MKLKLQERDLQRTCEDYLKLVLCNPGRGRYWHLEEARFIGIAGIPDIIGWIKLDKIVKMTGLTAYSFINFAYELKIDKHKPTFKQYQVMNSLKDEGWIVDWGNDFYKFKSWIDALLLEGRSCSK